MPLKTNLSLTFLTTFSQLLSLTSSFSLFNLNFPKHIIPPQANQPFPEFVTNLFYPCETHTITTADGYINTYFRIQRKHSTISPNLPVVYLQHGLLDSSDTWIVNVEDQAPAFILATEGYDVWLGNTRGNTYSQGHVSDNSSHPDSTYWNFSWQEMSLYDLPAAFQYIFNTTGKSITYIGHSQGTSIMFAALIRHDPIVRKYLKHFIALAPVVYVDNVLSPELDIIGKSKLGLILQVFQAKKLLFVCDPVRKSLELLCEFADAACIAQLRMISDTKPELDNTDRMDIILGHFPSGTSAQNAYYWNQLLLSQVFVMYDYGKKGNLEHYGQEKPPVYDLSKIDVPVYMFTGEYDELAYPNSTQQVRDQLVGSPKVAYKSYELGHASFVWGKNVTGYFTDVLEVMKYD